MLVPLSILSNFLEVRVLASLFMAQSCAGSWHGPEALAVSSTCFVWVCAGARQSLVSLGCLEQGWPGPHPSRSLLLSLKIKILHILFPSTHHNQLVALSWTNSASVLCQTPLCCNALISNYVTGMLLAMDSHKD